MAKATKHEVNRRVQKCYEMIVQAASRADILRYAAEKSGWGVKERTVETYIQRARELVSQEAKTYRAAALDTAIARMNLVISKALAVQDFQRVIAAQNQVNQLLGLYPPPPAQTIHLAGLNGSLLQQVVEALQAAGADPEETFRQLIQAANERTKTS